MSQHPESSDADLTSVAEQLRRLTPRPAGLDRDRVLFEAGRASAPRLWPWQAAAALGFLAALALGVTLLTRVPRPILVERIVHVPVPAEKTAPEKQPEKSPEEDSSPEERADAPTPAPANRYRQVEENLIRHGLDALGPPLLPGPRGDPMPGNLFDPL